MYKYGTVSNIEEELDKVISGNIRKIQFVPGKKGILNLKSLF